nr:hypothetical protein [Rahnella variigena]
MRNKEVERFKLWPTFRDQSHFIQSLNVDHVDDLRKVFPDSFTLHGTLRKHFNHPPSLEALWFFSHAFIKWISAEGHSLQENAIALIEAVLTDLKLVSISLEAEDDAQIIFETLNGRGLSFMRRILSVTIFLCVPEHDNVDAAALYENDWKPFENPVLDRKTTPWSHQQTSFRVANSLHATSRKAT